MEYQDANGLHMSDKQMQNVPYFLDRFYTNRISIRMLINQHGKYEYTEYKKNITIGGENKIFINLLGILVSVCPSICQSRYFISMHSETV